MPTSKTKMKNAAIAAKMAALPAIPKELIEQFVSGPMTSDAVNAATVAFKKALIERALGAEMSHYLGYPNGASKPEAGTANQRNGRSAKTVLTDDGPLRIEVPRDRAALEALPGVGRKTANVVLNTAFGEPTMAVDTHIFRVSNHTGLAPGKDVRAVEDALLRRVPKQYLLDAHHWLILHGRYVCKARRPECPACVIHDLCRWPDKTPPAG